MGRGKIGFSPSVFGLADRNLKRLFFLSCNAPLAEAPNGCQQRYVWVCSVSFAVVQLRWINICVVELCRLGGKALRFKKNHSSGNLIHNHKLFCGNMLSFIQVDSRLFYFLNLFFFSLFYSLRGFSRPGFGTAGSSHCSELHLLHQPPRQVFCQTAKHI